MTITNGYATVEEFKVRTGLTADQVANKTTLIEREIERNSRIIDRITGDKFYPITLSSSKVIYDFGHNADGLHMSDDCERIYFPGEVGTLTSVTNDGSAMVADVDYIANSNFIEAVNYFTQERTTGVVISGACGYSSVPDDINEVCLAMTEVTTGLGTYTVIDSAGEKTQITRDNIPQWVADRLYNRIRMSSHG